ncbi:hypothetical protein NDU88_000900 [Pleurodeles waltl]|uniref:Uncharacterized protein n=1 Tax=Pleurodeles waltl TaxID=8319 RepID=A0AAV7L853_PLEWA|nr:hypothetical protein NDU88_000900 [Pleurodeles waltl]
MKVYVALLIALLSSTSSAKRLRMKRQSKICLHIERAIFNFTDKAYQPAQEYNSFQELYLYEESEEGQHHVQNPSVAIPVSLVTDLDMMISDYHRRFPDAKAPAHHSPLRQDVQQAASTPKNPPP